MSPEILSVMSLKSVLFEKIIINPIFFSKNEDFSDHADVGHKELTGLFVAETRCVITVI